MQNLANRLSAHARNRPTKPKRKRRPAIRTPMMTTARRLSAAQTAVSFSRLFFLKADSLVGLFVLYGGKSYFFFVLFFSPESFDSFPALSFPVSFFSFFSDEPASA